MPLLDQKTEQASERRLVEDYLENHQIEEIMNTILNELVMERPSDPYLQLSHILGDMSKAARKINAMKAFELQGNNGMYLSVEIETTRGKVSATLGGRDYDEDKEEHDGKGYRKVALSIMALIVPKLLGMDPTEQEKIDKILNEQEGLSMIGKQVISLAVLKAGAQQKGLEYYEYIGELAGNNTYCMPVPIVTLIEGGKHAANKYTTQGVCIAPHGASTFADALESCTKVYKKVEQYAKLKTTYNHGKWGGYALDLKDNDTALTLLRQWIKECKFEDKISYGLDVNGNGFSIKKGETDANYNISVFDPSISPPMIRKVGDMIDSYNELVMKHPYAFLIDPLCNQHTNASGRLTENLKQFIQGVQGDLVENFKLHFDGLGGDSECMLQVIGDACLVNGSDSIEEVTTKKSFNAVCVGLWSAPTMTDLFDCIKKAQGVGMGIVASSDNVTNFDIYETMMMHIAVGLKCGQVRCGGLGHGEALSKYNELAAIEYRSSSLYQDKKSEDDDDDEDEDEKGKITYNVRYAGLYFRTFE